MSATVLTAEAAKAAAAKADAARADAAKATTSPNSSRPRVRVPRRSVKKARALPVRRLRLGPGGDGSDAERAGQPGPTLGREHRVLLVADVDDLDAVLVGPVEDREDVAAGESEQLVDAERLQLLAREVRGAATLDHVRDQRRRERISALDVVLVGTGNPALVTSPAHGLLTGGEALETAVDRVLSVFGGRPHIFNLGHGIDKETPIAHVEQLIRAVKGDK